MATLAELLMGFDATTTTTVDKIVALINKNAAGLKSKVLIDDGVENVFIPKARLDEEIGKRKTVQQTLDATNIDLEKIKVAAKGSDDLVKQIETLQGTNKDLDGKLKTQALDSAIKLKAMELKAMDGGDVLTLIDKSKLMLNDDGTVTGLDEALKTLATAKPYLFTAETGAGGGTGNLGQRGKETGKQETEGIGALLAAQAKLQTGAVDLVAAREAYFK